VLLLPEHTKELKELFCQSEIEEEAQGVILNLNGEMSKVWKKNGQYHRDGDKPAIIMQKGNREWYQHGMKHRNGDKPAVIYDSTRKYYMNDQLHRIGGPAVIDFRGERWFQYGVEQEGVLSGLKSWFGF
jgi:hypothetical protein